MNFGRNLLKNTILLSLAKLFGDFFTFLFLALLGRIFGSEVLGTYAFSMSLAGLLVICINLGFNTLTVREISRNPDNHAKFVGNLLVFQVVVSLIVMGLLVLVSLFSPFGIQKKIILCSIGGYQVFFSLIVFISSAFMALGQMRVPAFSRTFS